MASAALLLVAALANQQRPASPRQIGVELLTVRDLPRLTGRSNRHR
jgi:hypothetical protein